MDNVLEYLNNAQISAALIIPVLFVFFGAVLVFVFGFQKPDEPQFKKLSTSLSDNSRKGKKKEKLMKTAVATVATNITGKPSVDMKKSSRVSDENPKIKTIKKEDKTNKNKTVTNLAKKKDADNKISMATKKLKSSGKQEKLPKTEITNDDGGWQTVLSRTDKKKKNDEIIEATIKNALESLNSPKTDKKKKDKLRSKATNQKAEQEKPKQDKKKQSKASPEKVDEGFTIESINIHQENDSKIVAEKTEIVDSNDDPKPITALQQSTDIKEEKYESDNNHQSVNHAEQITEKLLPNSTENPGNVAFDELGDAWTEAKTPKKSKKKPRRE